MKKGKTLTALVLVAEIACIAVLHAVKINQSEKASAKEFTRNASAEVSQDMKVKTSYTLAAFK